MVARDDDDGGGGDEVDFNCERLAIAYFVDAMRKRGFAVLLDTPTGTVTGGSFRVTISWPRAVAPVQQ